MDFDDIRKNNRRDKNESLMMKYTDKSSYKYLRTLRSIIYRRD